MDVRVAATPETGLPSTSASLRQSNLEVRAGSSEMTMPGTSGTLRPSWGFGSSVSAVVRSSSPVRSTSPVRMAQGGAASPGWPGTAGRMTQLAQFNVPVVENVVAVSKAAPTGDSFGVAPRASRQVPVPVEVCEERVAAIPQVQRVVPQTTTPRVDVPKVEKQVDKQVGVLIPESMGGSLSTELGSAQVRQAHIWDPGSAEVSTQIALDTGRALQTAERVVGLDRPVTQEELVEVPVYERQELLREVAYPEVQIIPIPGEKKVPQYVDRIVDVPVTTSMEYLVEVPQIDTIEVRKEIPRVTVQEVEKRVSNKVIKVVEREVEVPHTVYQERVVEVPTVVYEAVVKQVPKFEYRYVDVEVPKEIIEYVEKIVEVPQVVYAERPVEVPEVHTVNAVTQVAQAEYELFTKEVAKVTLQSKENIVEVPSVLHVQQAKEVPEIRKEEVKTQVVKNVVQDLDAQVPSVSLDVQEHTVDPFERYGFAKAMMERQVPVPVQVVTVESPEIKEPRPLRQITRITAPAPAVKEQPGTSFNRVDELLRLEQLSAARGDARPPNKRDFSLMPNETNIGGRRVFKIPGIGLAPYAGSAKVLSG